MLVRLVFSGVESIGKERGNVVRATRSGLGNSTTRQPFLARLCHLARHTEIFDFFRTVAIGTLGETHAASGEAAPDELPCNIGKRLQIIRRDLGGNAAAQTSARPYSGLLPSGECGVLRAGPK